MKPEHKDIVERNSKFIEGLGDLRTHLKPVIHCFDELLEMADMIEENRKQIKGMVMQSETHIKTMELEKAIIEKLINFKYEK